MSPRHRRAWIFQDAKEVERVGERKAAWNVGWREPDGTRRQESCGTGAAGKQAAFRKSQKVSAQLVAGSYVVETETSWEDFRREYNETILASLSDQNAECIVNALDKFEELARPTVVQLIGAKSIDKYIAARRVQKGRKKDSKVSPATINKELRHIKSVLAYAVEWNHLAKLPNFKKRWLCEPDKGVRYTTPAHFASIYDACDTAKRPAGFPFEPKEFWRGMLVMDRMTGWRISELLALRKSDVNLDEATAVTRYVDNKGSRTEKVNLHPLVIEHIKPLMLSFSDFVFPWNKSRRQLYDEYWKIQKAAGIDLTCQSDGDPDHGKCTEACHLYSFHDERRAFATSNANQLTPLELKTLMRHKSFTTTQRYIDMAESINSNPSGKLAVPDLRKRRDA